MVDFADNSAKAIEDTATSKSLLRRHKRIPVTIRAVLYRKEKFEPVTIRDISAGGARLHGCDCLMYNDRIMIKLMSGRGLAARVRWWLGGACGVQFEIPLSELDPLLFGRRDHGTVLPERRRETSKSTA